LTESAQSVMEMHKSRMTGIPIALVAFEMAIVVGNHCLQITKRDVHVPHEFADSLSYTQVFDSVTSYIVLWTFLNQLGIVVVAGKGRQRPQFLPLSSLALFALPLLCVSSRARDTQGVSSGKCRDTMRGGGGSSEGLKRATDGGSKG